MLCSHFSQEWNDSDRKPFWMFLCYTKKTGCSCTCFIFLIVHCFSSKGTAACTCTQFLVLMEMSVIFFNFFLGQVKLTKVLLSFDRKNLCNDILCTKTRKNTPLSANMNFHSACVWPKLSIMFVRDFASCWRPLVKKQIVHRLTTVRGFLCITREKMALVPP